MDWIKKNPHLVTALAAAVALLVISGLLAWGAQGFDDKFTPVQATVIPNDNAIKPLELTELDQTQKELTNPASWIPAKDAGRLVVPQKYTVQDGVLIIATAGFRTDPYTSKPIPNAWFDEHGLSYTDPSVVLMDPDHDGFDNADEWRGEDFEHPGEVGQTDPNDPKSHPPYYTKLFFERYIRVAFRLKFNAYDGDVKKMDEMQFQINTLDLHQPSRFLKIGDMVPGTHFKLNKFELKSFMNPRTQSEEDVSELTVIDTESDSPVVLVLNKTIDSPDSYALFRYIWPKPAQAIQVKKLQQFVLKPEATADKEHLYKLLDVSETTATIKLPSGETKIIGRYMGKTPP